MWQGVQHRAQLPAYLPGGILRRACLPASRWLATGGAGGRWQACSTRLRGLCNPRLLPQQTPHSVVHLHTARTSMMSSTRCICILHALVAQCSTGALQHSRLLRVRMRATRAQKARELTCQLIAQVGTYRVEFGAFRIVLRYSNRHQTACARGRTWSNACPERLIAGCSLHHSPYMPQG